MYFLKSTVVVAVPYSSVNLVVCVRTTSVWKSSELTNNKAILSLFINVAIEFESDKKECEYLIMGTKKL